MNQPSDTRTAVLDAGRTLFARKGFDGASIRAITAAAGANLGAVTYHFGSKRALYEAVLTTELSAMRDAVCTVAASEGPAIDRMTAAVETYFRVLGEHPDLPRLMLQELAAGRAPPRPVAEIFRGIAGTLAHLQTEGEADGSVRPGDPLLTAFSLVAQPLYMSLVAPMIHDVLGLPTTDPEFRERMIDHASGFVRRGLAPTQEPA